MSEPLLVQYQAFTQRGMHFGRLYWQSIAFHFLLLLATAAIFRDLSGVALAVALMLAGLATLLMAFVVRRLWTQEGAYDLLLTNIETELRAQGHVAIQLSPAAGRRGARYMVNLSIAALGVALIIAGVIVLTMPVGQSAG
ncbi:MAG: hypothetical protein ABMA14_16735 [Hyphomonadaceae bacterium]